MTPFILIKQLWGQWFIWKVCLTLILLHRHLLDAEIHHLFVWTDLLSKVQEHSELECDQKGRVECRLQENVWLIVTLLRLSLHWTITGEVRSERRICPICSLHQTNCPVYSFFIFGLWGSSTSIYRSINSLTVCLLDSDFLKYLPSRIADSVSWIHFWASVFLLNVIVVGFCPLRRIWTWKTLDQSFLNLSLTVAILVSL